MVFRQSLRAALDAYDAQYGSVPIGRQLGIPNGHAARVEAVVGAARNVREDAAMSNDADRLRKAAHAVHRMNLDWDTIARTCGDPKCDGYCQWVVDLMAALAPELAEIADAP